MLEENSTYQLDGKNFKYGENKTNHIFTIDNTNVLKKTFTIPGILLFKKCEFSDFQHTVEGNCM